MAACFYGLMSVKSIKPRLHVLLSQDGRTGLIFRRGPSKRVCTFEWDRKEDTFTIGQWLQGRIYERRSDLSPGGKYLIYFAMNGRWESESKGSWTAVSRAPYLKALALWAKGDCWNGGGLFTSESSYWLNDGGLHHDLVHDTDQLERDENYSPYCHLGNAECLGVYFPRLLRDGWKLITSREEPRGDAVGRVTVFEKRLSEGWTLRKLAWASIIHPVGKGCYWDEHELVNLNRGSFRSLPTWEWAEADAARLVWAENGRLFAGHLSDEGPVDVRQLHDFSTYTYRRLKAPY